MTEPNSIDSIMTWLGGSAVVLTTIAAGLRWVYLRVHSVVEWIRPYLQKFFEAQIALIEHLKESHETLVSCAKTIEKKLDTQTLHIDEVREQVKVIHGHIVNAIEASKK